MSAPVVVNVDCAYRHDPGYDYEQGRIEAAGAELRLIPAKTEDEIIEACRDANVVLIEYTNTPITSRVLQSMPSCQAIVKAGIGLENVDIPAASREGIVVCNSAGFCTEEVSDHAIALLLAAARGIVSMDRNIRKGGWFDFAQSGPMRRIRSLTLGLIGFGQIGQAVARKLAGFAMPIVATDPYAPPAAGPPHVRRVSLEELLRVSDLISVHTPLTAESRGMLGEPQFRAMKPSAILVNTSRGAVIEEPVLIRALEERWIAAAALDVFEQEPLPAGHRLTALPNVVLTPHYAGHSDDSIADLKIIVADSAEAVARGFWPPFPANPDVSPRPGSQAVAGICSIARGDRRNLTPLRIGIIGSGFMGMTHAAAAAGADGTELVAIAGGRRAHELAAKHGVALEPTGQALIERNDVDAVVITTPHHVHAIDAIHAFRCGKHALVEKPMATTVEDCDAMIEAAARAGRTLAVGFQQRFRRNNREARRLVAEGELGVVLLAQVTMLPSVAPMLNDPGFSGWEWWLDPRSVGHILNSGPHAVDLLRWMLNSEPRNVSALCRTTRPNAQVEDTTAALLEFDNGTICVLSSSCVAPPPSFPGEEFRFRLMGSTAVMDLDPFNELRLSRDGALTPVSVQESVGHQDSKSLLGPARLGAYLDQMRNFVAATRGLPSEAATGQDGKVAVAACLGMLEASRRQAVIHLS